MNDEHKNKHIEPVCPSKKLDLVQVRSDLEKKNGPEFWRNLEELAGSPEFREMMHREFPKGASELVDSVSRRGFFKLMGSSLALAGMTACTKQPFEAIVPYVKQPEELVLGQPMFYATAFTLGGYGSPLLVTSREFRPIKIEGNDRHPASQGGTDVYAQASILNLYDPDRAQDVSYLGNIASWSELVRALEDPLNAQQAKKGAGLRILSQAFSSPTLADQKQQLLKKFPEAKWHFYEAVNRDNVYAGAQMAFGQAVETTYKLDAADVIVSLDAEFLYAGFPGMTRYARDFAKRRDPDSGNMSRFYAVESTPTSTGAKADHRLNVKASEVEGIARQLSQPGDAASGSSNESQFAAAVAKELADHHGSSVVIPGDHQPPVVHALCHAINAQLGNVGKTVFYSDPIPIFTGNHNDSLKELIGDMNSGNVEMLVILGANPVYDAPADFGFKDALDSSKVPLRIHLGQHNDETAEFCHWHVNEAHYLEAWGDTRAYDGTVSIVQPLIAPLYSGKSALEFVALLAGEGEPTGHELVQNYWQSKHSGADFDMTWRKWLEQGWIDDTASQEKKVSPKTTGFSPSAPADKNAIELSFRRDPSVYDGRFANNGWLQELPQPMTKLTWDNPLLMGPAMADRMGIKSMDMVRVELQNGKYLDLPVWIQAGQPDNSVSVSLGYGREKAGRVGNDQGFNTYTLRYSDAPWISNSVKQITNLKQRYILASTSGYQTMDVGDAERPIVRVKDLADYKQEPIDAEKPEQNETLYKPYDYKDEAYAWGMAIDLNACVGCNNCVIACQAENNIPVVGKDQVNHGRYMHWLRLDVYYQGDRDNPKMHFMPVPCMQCENAPCELVCPVGATVHSTEGLNDMIYNRCVGTRYCSNNCPYKVRRFNFFLFQDWDTPQFKMQRNPDVTVRSRGVMEKCTYCVQRLTHARIKAEEAPQPEDKKNIIGQLQTACQQSCPANAIVFGNINDPNSLVSKWKAKSRNYGLLDDLNTRPRTTYEAAVKNPNPELEKSS
ncbi:MAG TPA: TAT-variant-translocated molybdopterin oxidoreductase [Terriglobales bacterium]|jgi:molybdopterin-containing oxidoreductase family iron-sulfur binding subunit|nr:TAT-variant-translocated molybdopterin oxidoreductase [Terriglobales bacterium]